MKIMKKPWMFIFLLLMSKYIFIIFFLYFIYSQLTFPNFVKDHDFKNLMQLMLSKNQTQRFSKLEQIQSHIWFKDFSWDDLISLNLEPAFIPKIDINENKNNIYLLINNGNINIHSLFMIFSERNTATHEFIHANTNTPKINFERISFS